MLCVFQVSLKQIRVRNKKSNWSFFIFFILLIFLSNHLNFCISIFLSPELIEDGTGRDNSSEGKVL